MTVLIYAALAAAIAAERQICTDRGYPDGVTERWSRICPHPDGWWIAAPDGHPDSVQWDPSGNAPDHDDPLPVELHGRQALVVAYTKAQRLEAGAAIVAEDCPRKAGLVALAEALGLGSSGTIADIKKRITEART